MNKITKNASSLVVLACCASISVGQARRTQLPRGSNPPPPPLPAAVAPRIDVSGKLEGSTYTNAFFGFTLTLPHGWQAQDIEVKKQFTEVVKDKAQEDSVMRQRAYQASIARTSLLLIAVKPTEERTNPLVISMAEDIGLAFNIRTPRQYAEQLRQLSIIDKNSLLIFEDEVKTERIGGVEFAVVDAVARNPNITPVAKARQSYYLTVRNKYGISFILTYHSPEELQACKEMLASLKFQ